MNSITDLRRYVSGLLENYDCSLYGFGEDHDGFVESVAEIVRDFIHDRGFVWGEELPEISNEDFAECVNASEVK